MVRLGSVGREQENGVEMLKTVTNAFSNALSILKRPKPDNQQSPSVEQNREPQCPFADFTSQQSEVFNARAEEISRNVGKDYYRHQPDNYTIDDLAEEIEARKS